MGSFEAEVLVVEYFTEGIYAGWTDADPLKLISQAEALGYGHCIAIRRSLAGPEMVTYQPLTFLPSEWGNLIFLQQTSYAQLRAILAASTGQLEQSAMEKITELQQCCDERLALIKYLHAEAEKRLRLIEELTHRGSTG